MRTHQNKIAIITGGKQGIGRGIADLLAQRGAKVVLVNRQDASEAATQIGNGAIAITADVTRRPTGCGWPPRWSRHPAVPTSSCMRPVSPDTGLDQMTQDEWHRVMAVNLDAHVIGARNVPLMRKAGGVGRSLR